MLPKLFFGYYAVVIVFLSMLVVTRKNPVHSVMWMLLLFFHIAGLYLFLNAEFIAAIQVIVYAGAILVLFLFVVLLLNLKEELKTDRFIGPWPIAFVIASAFFVIVSIALKSLVIAPQGKYSAAFIQQETHTKALGQLLYTEFLFPFEIVSLILLVAVVGAIVLAKRKLRS
ncbi:MAG: NADH-ubiquinone/plastoquinone oxidoreductase chain 6 [Nitrospira bacterium HGW-Nitrospira-1]|nr:MAG: NADH-ubiquinone/plastoquinone oxidoreductase chain 6 [Nitrospira bacterium HGW-Nitrospira-1]